MAPSEYHHFSKIQLFERDLFAKVRVALLNKSQSNTYYRINLYNLLTAYRLLCTAPATSLSLAAINLDDNLIESVANDPFQFCSNLTHISLARNRIDCLSSGLFFVCS